MTQDYKILLDVPVPSAGPLALGFGELATAFEQVIERSDPQFAIGLFGGWGSGKTTLMRAIRERLDADSCATVWFSAWRYEKEEHLIVPLLDVIREALVDWADAHRGAPGQVADTALEVAATIGRATRSLLAGFSLKAGLPGTGIDVSFDANKALSEASRLKDARHEARVPRSFYHASFRAMQDAFAEFTHGGARRIVVFVDDLDRCLAEGALEVLESMKLFFDLPGFVFVVGLDRRVVELSIEKRYREMMPPAGDAAASRRREAITGAQYLRKIFQVPFGLAPVSAAQIDEFLWSVRDTANLPPEQWREIDEDVRPHLSYLVDEGGVNPREVKRFINGYTLVRKIKQHLDPGVVLALQTIAFRPDWSEVQLALLAYRDVFVDALRRQADDPEAGHLGALSPGLEAPPQSFLTYVGIGEPGSVLVRFAESGQSIDEYIFSGEATRSGEASEFVNLFRMLGDAALAIRSARDKGSAAEHIASVLGSALGALRSSSAGRFEVAQRELHLLIVAVEASEWRTLIGNSTMDQTERREQLDALAEIWLTRLRGIMGTLQEFYRAGLTAGGGYTA